jgi:hypothetical protein
LVSRELDELFCAGQAFRSMLVDTAAEAERNAEVIAQRSPPATFGAEVRSRTAAAE